MKETWAAWPDRAWVRGVMVLTLNGSHLGATGSARDLSGPTDRAMFLAQRREADAILVGARTAATDDYGAIKFDQSTRHARTSRGQPPTPEIYVATNRYSLDPDTRLARENPETKLVRPDPAHLMALLLRLKQRGRNRVLCEGGPTLLTTMIDNDLIDDLLVTYQMQLCPQTEDFARARPPTPRRFRLRAQQLVDTELLTHWVRDDHESKKAKS